MGRDSTSEVFNDLLTAAEGIGRKPPTLDALQEYYAKQENVRVHRLNEYFKKEYPKAHSSDIAKMVKEYIRSHPNFGLELKDEKFTQGRLFGEPSSDLNQPNLWDIPITAADAKQAYDPCADKVEHWRNELRNVSDDETAIDEAIKFMEDENLDLGDLLSSRD